MIDEIEDFIALLEKRISEYIFFEFIRCEFDGLRVLLNFLGNLGNSIILFQTTMDFPNVKNKKIVIEKIKQIDVEKLNLNLKFIPGSVREIYLSIS
ncbi:MAG: hypothetical protein ACTSVY_14055 [Candidatus Helarchaeota archaeon]